MIGMRGVMNGIIPVLCRKFQEQIFLPLKGCQAGEIDTVSRDAGTDLETIVARPRRILLEDIAAEILAGGVEPLAVYDGLAFEIPPVGRLVTQDADEFVEIGPQGVRQWLVVVAVVRDGIIVLIGKRTHDIGLQLKIEVLHIEHIDPFKAQLQPLLIGPIAIAIMYELMQDELIEKHLTIELGGMTDINLPVQAGIRLIRAAILLLRGDQEDHGIEIREIEMVGAAKGHILEHAQGEPRRDIDIQVMHHPILLGILIVVTSRVLVGEFHVDGLVVQLPDAGIELQEKIRSAVVAQDKTAIPVANEVLVVAELPVEIFPGVEIDGSAIIVIIETRSMKGLIIARAGHRIVPARGHPLLKPAGAPFLVIGEIGRKTELIGDHAPQGDALGIEKDRLFISRLMALHTLDHRIDGQKEVLVLYLVKVRLGLIEGVEPGMFAHKAVPVVRYPFDVVGHQGGQIGTVDGGKMIDIVIGIPMVKRIGYMRDVYGQPAADGFAGGDVEIFIRLLLDLHSFQEMIELRILRQKSGLGACQAR